MKTKNISPSLICMNLCNLENEIKSLEKLGCNMVHIDIIDGIFSPDMPLGIGTIEKLRKFTDMTFDIHLMSVNNTPFVDLLLNCGIDRLCFHTGYAHLAGQTVYPQIEEKIAQPSEYIKKYYPDLEIEVDGRVGFEETKKLLDLGVDTFVSGTKGLFYPECTREENWEKLQKILKGNENV